MVQTQIVYAKPPADGMPPDPAGTFNVDLTGTSRASRDVVRHDPRVVAQFMIVLDPTIVTVALRSIESKLRFGSQLSRRMKSTWQST
jgi:hypothetical protein